MRLRHNYTILDIECLVNLKGLLAYTAERVQLGKLCLNCSKQFKTPDRCQQHMLDMGHTMMSLDNEKEFEIFYDFARAYAHLNTSSMKRKGAKPALIAPGTSPNEVMAEAESEYDLVESTVDASSKQALAVAK